MKMIQRLKYFEAIPITHSVLLSCLEDYKNPNDKIKQMVHSGELIRVKQGLYIVGDIYRDAKVSRGLLANQIYGPSYISFDFALSFYGLIPERVYEVTSVTTKMAKSYDTPLGRFTYIKSSLKLYNIGVSIEVNSDGTSYMIATAEKALCDKLAFTKNLGISSQKAMKAYIEEDLRIDLDELKAFDLSIIKACAECGYKSGVLTYLYNTIKKLQEHS